MQNRQNQQTNGQNLNQLTFSLQPSKMSNIEITLLPNSADDNVQLDQDSQLQTEHFHNNSKGQDLLQSSDQNFIQQQISEIKHIYDHQCQENDDMNSCEKQNIEVSHSQHLFHQKNQEIKNSGDQQKNEELNLNQFKHIHKVYEKQEQELSFSNVENNGILDKNNHLETEDFHSSQMKDQNNSHQQILETQEHKQQEDQEVISQGQQQVSDEQTSPQLQNGENKEIQYAQAQYDIEQQSEVHVNHPLEILSMPSFGVEDHNIFRLIKMLDNDVRKVMHLIFMWGSKLMQKKEMTVEEYLKNIKNFTDVKYAQLFNKDSKEKITKDRFGEEFDITLLYKCIQWVCENIAPPSSKKWLKKEDTLEYNLTVLKDIRNNLKHRVKISTEEFIQMVEKLRDTCKRSLQLAGIIYSVASEKVECHIEQLNKNINEIRDCSIEDFDINAYNNRVLLNDLSRALHESGKKEITITYDRFQNFNPVSFITGEQVLINVGTIFTQLEVIDNMKQDEKENKKIDYEDLLQFDNTEHLENSKLRLLEGSAGSGKTTLTRKMMEDWCSGSNKLKEMSSFNFLLYMECRDSTNSTFSELLESLLPETAKQFSNDDLKKCMLNLKLFIIVDGIDELNTNSTALFRELLEYKTKHDILLFCTTRPERVEDFYKMLPSGERVVHLKVVGISDSRRVEFASRYHEEMRRLGKSTKETKGLKDYLTTDGSRLQEHWRLPLNLVLLVVLWSIVPEKVNTVTTATELYFEIYKLTVEKLLERLKCNELTHHYSIHHLKRNVNKFVLDLCWEALSGLKKDEIIISASALKTLESSCGNLDLPADDTVGAFLVKKIFKTANGMVSRQNFPHKGLQDFYSAICLLLKVKEKGIKIDLSHIIDFDMNEGTTPNERPNIFRRMKKRTRRSLLHIARYISMTKLLRSISKPILKVMGISLESTTKITEVLEDLHPDDKMTRNYQKFNNAFVHFTGLLHMISEGDMDKRLVTELVTTLYHTGVKRKDQWLELLADVKCDDIVAEVIANRVFATATDNLKIEDKRVFSYKSLCVKKCPKTVSVVINSKPEDLPRLKELLEILWHHQCVVVELSFRYNFQYPTRATHKMDDITVKVFRECSVENYCGLMSTQLLSNLPKTISKLRVSILNHLMCNQLRSILCTSSYKTSYINGGFSVDSVESNDDDSNNDDDEEEEDDEEDNVNDRNVVLVPKLRRLVLHFPPGIDHEQLQPFPLGVNIHLIMSGVTPDNLDSTLNTIKGIQPLQAASRRGFATILFPMCTLGAYHFRIIIQEVIDQKIIVGCTIATSCVHLEASDVEEFNELADSRFKFVLMPDDDIFDKW